MRTNIVIDDGLMADAMSVSGIRIKRELVEQALQHFIQLHRQREIIEYRGKLHWEGDLDAMRLD